ncbi:MAG: ABC transporter permease [Coriobacteriales bacterium]|jgi:peptide/nickel transport system permease protein|nr:ABC transporter permease [Coriobacteriales bacterium]
MMASLLLRRIGISFLVVFGAITLVFYIVYLLPGDPINSLVDTTTMPPEEVENLRYQLGLDKPVHVRFVEYIGSVLQGDLGKSYVNSVPVIDTILKHLPATLLLALASTIIAVVVGVVFGILSAVHRNSWVDMVVRAVSMFHISMPTFWFGILLILVFSFVLGWLPAMGSKGIKTLILPSLTLGLATSATILRLVRSNMLEVIDESFITTLRAKGLSERLVLYRHALRNALIPTVTIVGTQLGGLLGGVVIVETVFSRQGIGRILVDAVLSRDVPVIQGVVLFTSILIVLINLLVDISYAVIDPRIKLAGQQKG